ncbi:MAG: 23S rRNA (adenine(2503)-C(2))-methyltransferase [Lentisphaerae bacterium GWF2_45_14]|nr:MAG: 23S rRNA (adenine(2503)-C(2))-methyltransferase [Lentisphaerae bacterium GWF2_45_14]
MRKPFLCLSDAGTLKHFLTENGFEVFRTKQLIDWIFNKRVDDPAKMLNIPKKLRDALSENFICASSKIEEVSEAEDGTKKLLIKLSDGKFIESVIIPSRERITFCLSSQVGCPVQCRFCASGKNGLERNLKAGEIIEQFLLTCETAGKAPDNIVFMGIGEGLLNFENLSAALLTLVDSDRFSLSPRRITVSTSGWTKGILELARLRKQFNLALSLHAADDKIREKLIPDKFRRPISEILKACDTYRENVGRMVTFEYTMLKGINDSSNDAVALSKLARTHHAKVNLIPYNEIGSPKFSRPKEETIGKFEAILARNGIQFTRRTEKGSSKSAACGQLRAAQLKKKS